MATQADFRRAELNSAPRRGQVTGAGADTNKYDVSSMQYPEDLDSSEEWGGHKVVFFINVPSNSTVGEGRVAAQAAASGVGASQISHGTGTTALPPTRNGSKSGSTVSGGQALATALNAPVGGHKRMTSAISLYMPNQLSNTYGVQWDVEDFSNAAVWDQIAGGAANVIGNPTLKTSADEANKTILTAGGKAISRKILDGIPYLQKATNITQGNSKQEQLFKSVDFRTFQFSFEFFPRSESEAQTVLRIIRMFRYHMLPEYLDEGNFLYIYPSEFDIKYYTGDSENSYLEKQMTAVLTNMTINTTPNGQFSTFASGMPNQLNIQLSFKELAVPTKETSPFGGSGV